jgi:hypothetical protein
VGGGAAGAVVVLVVRARAERAALGLVLVVVDVGDRDLEGLVADLDHVALDQPPLAARLDRAVDAHRAALDQHLRLATGRGDPGQLERVVETQGLAGIGWGRGLSVGHGGLPLNRARPSPVRRGTSRGT